MSPSPGPKGQTTQSLTGSRASVPAHLRDRKIVIASEWWIHSEGVVDIEARFEKLCLDGKIVPIPRCVWLPGKQCFVINCPPILSKSVPQLFVQAFRGLIKEEEEDNGIYDKRHIQGADSASDSEFDSDADDTVITDDEITGDYVPDDRDTRPIDSNKIQRLKEYLNRRKRQTTSSYEHDDQLINSEGVRYPDNISPLDHKYVWPSPLDLDVVCPGRTLQRLISLTGCLMVKSLNEREIFIGATLEENIHLAISKLDNLVKYGSPLPFVGHSFYTEEIANYQLSLQRLYDVKIAKDRKLFETTLIDGLECMYDRYSDNGFLEKFVTVRCATHVPERGNHAPVKTKVSLTSQQPNFSESWADWAGFHYAGKGNPASNPLRHFTAEEMRKMTGESQLSQVSIEEPPPVEKVPYVDPGQALMIEEWKENAILDDATGFKPAQPLKPTKHEWDPCEGSEFPSFDNVPGLEIATQEPVLTPFDCHITVKPRAIFEDDWTASEKSANSQAVSQKFVPNSSPAWGTSLKANSNDYTAAVKLEKWPTLAASAKSSNKLKAMKSKAATTVKSENHTMAWKKVGEVTTQTNLNHNLGSKHRYISASVSDNFDSKNTELFNEWGTNEVPPATTDVSNYPPLGNTTRPKQEPTNSTNRTQDTILDNSEDTILDKTLKQDSYRPLLDFPPATINKQPSLNPTKHLLDDELPELSFAPMEFTTSQQIEKLQTKSEVETRTFHNTMNQKMPKPNAARKSQSLTDRLERPDPPGLGKNAEQSIMEIKKPADPLPAFINELEGNFSKLLQGVRGFRGGIKLEAQFGRILLRGLKATHIADKEDKDHSLQEASLQRLLNPAKAYTGGSKPTTSFTNKLTTLPEEITTLLKVKDPEGVDLWTSHTNWDVFYRFTFREKITDMPFVIDINAETFATRAKFRQGFGQLNVHGTKRTWDFRILLEGVKLGEEDVDKYAELATKLQETLFIPSCLDSPELYAEFDNVLQAKFCLEGIRLHKVNSHRSTSNKSILVLTEILDLECQIGKPKGQDNVHVISARCDKMIPGSDGDGEKRWFTASIESVRGNEILAQNVDLELGDEAGWTPETFATVGVLGDLYIPACQMLKEMDDVGFYNNNGVRRAPRAPKPEPPQTPYSFW